MFRQIVNFAVPSLQQLLRPEGAVLRTVGADINLRDNLSSAVYRQNRIPAQQKHLIRAADSKKSGYRSKGCVCPGPAVKGYLEIQASILPVPGQRAALQLRVTRLQPVYRSLIAINIALCIQSIILNFLPTRYLFRFPALNDAVFSHRYPV